MLLHLAPESRQWSISGCFVDLALHVLQMSKCVTPIMYTIHYVKDAKHSPMNVV